MALVLLVALGLCGCSLTGSGAAAQKPVKPNVLLSVFDEFGGEVALSPVDFPPGVVMHAPPVREGIDTVPVVFEAAPDAPTGGKLAGVNVKPTKADEKLSGAFVQSVNRSIQATWGLSC